MVLCNVTKTDKHKADLVESIDMSCFQYARYAARALSIPLSLTNTRLSDAYNACFNPLMITSLHFTGPPVPITARVHSTPQRPFPFSHRLVQFPTSSHCSSLKNVP
eukprot:9481705-Pyramimonas_sp.AAC.1